MQYIIFLVSIFSITLLASFIGLRKTNELLKIINNDIIKVLYYIFIIIIITSVIAIGFAFINFQKFFI